MSDLIRQTLADALDPSDCVKLMRAGRKWSKLRTEGKSHFKQSKRLAVLCAATSEVYTPLLEVSSAARGLYLDVFQTPFGTWQQNILDSNSALHAFKPELILLHLMSSQITHWPSIRTREDEVCFLAEKEVEAILAWCRSIHSRHSSQIYLTNFHIPPFDSLGGLGARLPGSATLFVQRVNLLLAEKAPSFVRIIDVAGLAARYGVRRWFDPVAWNHAKQPFAYDAMPLFVQSVAAALATSCVSPSKCLVLDLDNTLWGGVVADDGLEGIALGQGSSQGEAYLEFQRYLLSLRQRGLLLAVCSKNQESIAREVFEKHDEMVIKLSDISVFVANFTPKAENIVEIAKRLNIGLDSLVFIDDNPVERDQMRQFRPEVKVIEMPSDPSQYVAALEDSFFFEASSLTDEDLSRADAYAANDRRAELAAQITDLKAFLKSLEMTATISPYGHPHLERVTQLINKSNQFNLCTVRYTQAELEAIAQDKTWITVMIRLQDRFGDNGLVSAIHGQLQDGILFIRNWVMSCRVLDRGVEQLAINQVVEEARKQGCKIIQGTYIPTAKNALVSEHYRKLGFELLADTEDGHKMWKLALEKFRSFEPPILTNQMDL
jgi:FkbH-like protein